MVKILFILLFPFLLFAQKPKLLLLKTYKDQNISGWVMSEKLDGVRAYWNGKKLLTRNGNEIDAPQWFIKKLPPFVLDGELWSKRGEFDYISSVIRGKMYPENWEKITYNIFEVPHAKGNLFERLKKAKKIKNNYVKIVKQIAIKDKKHLKQFLKEIEAKKGEGVVIRDPNTPYIDKRTSKALKVKSFQDTECEVVGYSKGKGKYKDMLGAVYCKLKSSIIFKIGIGFSDKERKYPPKMGDIITFKYQNMTKNGKPRFPVYLRVRHEAHISIARQRKSTSF